MSDYLEVNLANWNERAAAHAASPSYPVQRFADDPAYLSSVVQFDRALLGDITGHRGIHLQCHIGTDTVSLARLGAEMTGLDFSDQSLDQAHRIAALANAEIVTAVLEAGMTLTGLVEHTTVPWEAVPGRMHQLDNGEWQLSDRPERLPHTYTLQAVR